MKFSITIQNKQGIHLKPATAIAKIALNHPETTITLQKGNKIADAKSVISLLALEVIYQSEITFKLEGKNANKCKIEIDKLIFENLL